MEGFKKVSKMKSAMPCYKDGGTVKKAMGGVVTERSPKAVKAVDPRMALAIAKKTRTGPMAEPLAPLSVMKKGGAAKEKETKAEDKAENGKEEPDERLYKRRGGKC